jgi:hypothetical protein
LSFLLTSFCLFACRFMLTANIPAISVVANFGTDYYL